MLVRQFKILLQVRECLNQGQTARVIANRLKLHPFVVQKSLLPARRFLIPVLKNIGQRLLVIDEQAKTGRIDIKTALSQLIAQIWQSWTGLSVRRFCNKKTPRQNKGGFVVKQIIYFHW